MVELQRDVNATEAEILRYRLGMVELQRKPFLDIVD